MINRIFYIQNPIALLVAEKLIETHAYSENECLFIYGRNMKPKDSKFKCILWDGFVHQYSWNFIEGSKKIRQTKKTIDDLISKEVGDTYSLYTASFSLWFLKYLAQHPKCRDFNFLEEGAGSFFTQSERKKKQNSTFFTSRIFYYLKILLSHSFQYFPNPHIERSLLKKSKAIYVFSNEGFADYPQRVQIDPPFKKKDKLKHIKAVFAPWYILESGVIEKGVYLNALRKAFNKMYELGETVIHYKFHPQHLVKRQFINDYECLFNEFKGRIEFIELEVSISLENIAFTSKANFYVDISSVALYAKSCGSAIYSYCDYLIAAAPHFTDFPLPTQLKNVVFPGNLLTTSKIN